MLLNLSLNPYCQCLTMYFNMEELERQEQERLRFQEIMSTVIKRPIKAHVDYASHLIKNTDSIEILRPSNEFEEIDRHRAQMFQNDSYETLPDIEATRSLRSEKQVIYLTKSNKQLNYKEMAPFEVIQWNPFKIRSLQDGRVFNNISPEHFTI